MREAGAPSTRKVQKLIRSVPAPPGVVMVALQTLLRKAEGRRAKAALCNQGGRPTRPTIQALYKAGAPYPACEVGEPRPANGDGQDRADALGWGRHPNRPKTIACNPTIPQKVTNVSIYDKGPEPSRPESSDPMIEAGAPDTVKLLLRFRYRCARPTGGRMVAPPEVPRNVEGG